MPKRKQLIGVRLKKHDWGAVYVYRGDLSENYAFYDDIDEEGRAIIYLDSWWDGYYTVPHTWLRRVPEMDEERTEALWAGGRNTYRGMSKEAIAAEVWDGVPKFPPLDLDGGK